MINKLAKPRTCAECGTGWFATHTDEYAYHVCACDYAGSSVPASYPAPAGLPVAGEWPDSPHGGVTPSPTP